MPHRMYHNVSNSLNVLLAWNSTYNLFCRGSVCVQIIDSVLKEMQLKIEQTVTVDLMCQIYSTGTVLTIVTL